MRSIMNMFKEDFEFGTVTTKGGKTKLKLSIATTNAIWVSVIFGIVLSLINSVYYSNILGSPILFIEDFKDIRPRDFTDTLYGNIFLLLCLIGLSYVFFQVLTRNKDEKFMFHLYQIIIVILTIGGSILVTNFIYHVVATGEFVPEKATASFSLVMTIWKVSNSMLINILKVYTANQQELLLKAQSENDVLRKKLSHFQEI